MKRILIFGALIIYMGCKVHQSPAKPVRVYTNLYPKWQTHTSNILEQIEIERARALWIYRNYNMELYRRRGESLAYHFQNHGFKTPQTNTSGSTLNLPKLKEKPNVERPRSSAGTNKKIK